METVVIAEWLPSWFNTLLNYGMASLLLVPIMGPLAGITFLATKEFTRGPKFLRLVMIPPFAVVIIWPISVFVSVVSGMIDAMLSPNTGSGIKILILSVAIVFITYIFSLLSALIFLSRERSPWKLAGANGLPLRAMALFAKIYAGPGFYKNSHKISN
jgi:hypothetical protein